MKILLVDDARSVVQVMTSRLSSYGYEVVFVENGKVAVERFIETSPDLVLIDIAVNGVSQLAIPHELNAEWGKVTSSVGVAHMEAAKGELVSFFVSQTPACIAQRVTVEIAL